MLLIVVAASFFASSFPDGLDYLAGKLGFLHKGMSGSAIMKNYSMTILGGGPLSTAISGLVGIGVILGLFVLFRAMLIFSGNQRKGENS